MADQGTQKGSSIGAKRRVAVTQERACIRVLSKGLLQLAPQYGQQLKQYEYGQQLKNRQSMGSNSKVTGTG